MASKGDEVDALSINNSMDGHVEKILLFVDIFMSRLIYLRVPAWSVIWVDVSLCGRPVGEEKVAVCLHFICLQLSLGFYLRVPAQLDFRL